MINSFTNAPAPNELLLTARESLKAVLREPAGDHAYTLLMAMNAMGIAARAMEAEAAPPAHPGMNDADFRRWVRKADETEIMDPDLISGLLRNTEGRLAVANPRFRPEALKDEA